MTQDCAPLSILGPRISTSHNKRTDPGFPVLSEKGDATEGKWDTELGTLRQLRGGRMAGRLGMESLELGKCRGLLQGLLLGLTLAPALEIQVGRMG